MALAFMQLSQRIRKFANVCLSVSIGHVTVSSPESWDSWSVLYGSLAAFHSAFVSPCVVKRRCDLSLFFQAGQFYQIHNFRSLFWNRKSCCSVVGIAICYGLDDREGRGSSSVKVKNFHFYQTIWGALSPWLKRLGREAIHSHPTSAEARKTWFCTCTPTHTSSLA
jgi:hypothetical protein